MHFFNINSHLCRNFSGQRISSQILKKPPANLFIFENSFHHVNGNPYGAGLIGESPGNGLPYPPSRVSGKFKTSPIIKLFNGLKKAEIALLYQIKKRKMG